MNAWVGQVCFYVRDLERTVRLYEALGLACTSRTEIPGVQEAIVEDAGGKGGKIQLAQRLEGDEPIDHGNALWKLYVNSTDMERMYAAALEAGWESVSAPERADRWPVTIAFVKDPDGYLVELVQRHPWLDGDTKTPAWVGQHCLYVSDLEAAISFYETLGLTCTSRTDIPGIHEAIVEDAGGRGSKIQLAQPATPDAPIDMGSAMWKLYVNTDDIESAYGRAIAAGHTSLTAPMRLDRWPVSIAFVGDPDGYQVELVQRHES